MKKKTVLPHGFERQPPGDHSTHSTNLPLRKTMCSLLYLKGCLLIATKQAVVFLGKCVQTAAKTMAVDRKKPEGASSAIIGVGTAAKYCELKHCADRVRSTEPTTKMKFQ